MAHRQTKHAAASPASGSQASVRPSLRIALQLSLGMHALMLLMLFRMYSEYVHAPEEHVQIIARATAPRDQATPSFIAVPLAVEDRSNETSHPMARTESLPYLPSSFDPTQPISLHRANDVGRRAPIPAQLSPLPVVVPDSAVTPVEATTASELITTPAATLERSETLRDVPVRVASRPIYGPRPQRPLGLATLPELAGEDQQPRPAAAFAHRHSGLRTPPENRTAIDRGLDFLARVQLDNGSWQFRNLRQTVDPSAELPSARADAAATGLSLLAFLGAGQDHFEGRYRRVVQSGLDYLMRVQHENGAFFPLDGGPTGKLSQFYSHGIATLALCEAYGMTGDEKLRGPAQRALNFLVGAHHAEPGAWRYLPGIDADTSAIGWQLATLRSGQLAGLHVDPQLMATIRSYITRMRELEARQSDTVNTAVGIAVELHLDDSQDIERFRPAADDLLAQLPEVREGAQDENAVSPENHRRDTYYWYYGSEAMYHLGGNDWSAWSQQLYPQLLESQLDDGPFTGSWNPPQSKLAAESTSGGRLYVTAMNLLSLEIQNRNLPQVSPVAIRPPELKSAK